MRSYRFELLQATSRRAGGGEECDVEAFKEVYDAEKCLFAGPHWFPSRMERIFYTKNATGGLAFAFAPTMAKLDNYASCAPLENRGGGAGVRAMTFKDSLTRTP